MNADAREQLYDSVGKSLLVGGVGEACEIARAYLFLMQEGYSTGQTVAGRYSFRRFGREQQVPGWSRPEGECAPSLAKTAVPTRCRIPNRLNLPIVLCASRICGSTPM